MFPPLFYHKKLFIFAAGWFCVLLLLSHFSRVRLCATHRRQPTRLPCPWDSPGKNTGVGCHFLLQCMKVKSERKIAQSCPTLGDPMDCSPPGSSVHGIFQARVLEWGAIAFSGWFCVITPKAEIVRGKSKQNNTAHKQTKMNLALFFF